MVEFIPIRFKPTRAGIACDGRQLPNILLQKAVEGQVRFYADRQDERVILSAVEIVPIHTSPKRKRGNDLATSLALRVRVSLNRRAVYQSDKPGKPSNASWVMR